MALNLSILYRGPLSSCNYACSYCPFAKRRESIEELARDRAALERFVAWVAARPASDRLGILFTPWGEALTRSWYRNAMAQLTHMRQVVKTAAQTNLSCRLDWVERCEKPTLALWATFHPTETTLDRFLNQCQELERRDVRYSVGVVGLREHFEAIRVLRSALPEHIYLWVNAYKDVSDYYRPGEVEWLTEVDPLFSFNNRRHPSLGRPCRTGSSVISVDGDGVVRRCHFVRQPLGNLYETDIELLLNERPCPNATCGCHIGYVHMLELELDRVFGAGLLERIPERLPLPVTEIAGQVSMIGW